MAEKYSINYQSLDDARARYNRIQNKAGPEATQLRAYIQDWMDHNQNPNELDPAAYQYKGAVPTPKTAPRTRTTMAKKYQRYEQDELKQFYPLMSQLEQERGLAPGILSSIAGAETGHIGKWSTRTRVKSPAGAIGLMQFMPETGARYGLNTYDDLINPEKAIRAAADYLVDIRKTIGSNDPKLLAAGYNAGENRQSLKQGRVPNIPETQTYIGKTEHYRTEANTPGHPGYGTNGTVVNQMAPGQPTLMQSINPTVVHPFISMAERMTPEEREAAATKAKNRYMPNEIAYTQTDPETGESHPYNRWGRPLDGSDPSGGGGIDDQTALLEKLKQYAGGAMQEENLNALNMAHLKAGATGMENPGYQPVDPSGGLASILQFIMANKNLGGQEPYQNFMPQWGGQ